MRTDVDRAVMPDWIFRFLVGAAGSGDVESVSCTIKLRPNEAKSGAAFAGVPVIATLVLVGWAAGALAGIASYRLAWFPYQGFLPGFRYQFPGGQNATVLESFLCISASTHCSYTFLSCPGASWRD